jgi:hypothetical protein
MLAILRTWNLTYIVTDWVQYKWKHLASRVQTKKHKGETAIAHKHKMAVTFWTLPEVHTRGQTHDVSSLSKVILLHVFIVTFSTDKSFSTVLETIN